MIDFFWPQKCKICNSFSGSHFFCESHLNEIKNLSGFFTSEIKISNKIYPVFSFFQDDPIVRKALFHWKFNGNSDFLREILPAEVPRVFQEDFLKVPANPLRNLWRSYDPVHQFWSEINRRSWAGNLTKNKPVIRKVFAKRQRLLNLGERKKNAKNLFTIKEFQGNDQPTDCQVWVIDDFISSGETLKSFGESLQKISLNVLGFVVLVKFVKLET